MKGKNTGWIVVFASVAALTVGATGIVSYAHNIFLKPMTEEFHWTRAQYFSAFSIAGVIGAFLPPFIGRAADRWGIKRVLLPGIVAFALATMNLALLNGSAGQFLVFAILSSATAMFQSPPLYSKAVAAWFDNKRGLALAIAMTGSALSGILIPPFANFLVQEFGWRIARVGLGLSVLVIAVPVVWFFLDEPDARNAPHLSRAPSQGIDIAAAARTAAFWLILVSFLLSGAAANAMMTNLGPLLTDHGNAASLAAVAISTVAMGQLVGRFVSGFLLDRFATPKVGLYMLFAAFAGTYLLIYGQGVPLLFCGAALLGLGLGSELELAAFYISRYFGLKHFGQIYGYIFGAYIIGVAGGSFLMGWAYDISRDYWLGFLGVETALVIAALLLFLLGPYVFTPRRGFEAEAADAEGAAKLAERA